MDRVAEIIEHEKLADEADASADEHRWAAARLMAEEVAAGKTKERLSQEIGKSRIHVFRYVTAWTTYAGVRKEERPSFAEACNSANPRGTTLTVGQAEALGLSAPETVTVTAETNDGWEPRQLGRAPADEGETAGGRANQLVDEAVTAITRLSNLPASWAFLDAGHHALLGELPAQVRALLAAIASQDDR